MLTHVKNGQTATQSLVEEILLITDVDFWTSPAVTRSLKPLVEMISSTSAAIMTQVRFCKI